MLNSAIRRFAQQRAGTAPMFAQQHGRRSFATATSKPHTPDHVPASMNHEHSHAFNVALALRRFLFTNPIPITFLFVGGYRISTNINPEDEANHKQGGKVITDLRQARRDSLKAYKELYWQQEDNMNYSKSWYGRKGMREGTTALVKTNSFRPGGKEQMEKKRSQGVSRRKSVGLYDSEGLVDASR
jgi:hypothetical protein